MTRALPTKNVPNKNMPIEKAPAFRWTRLEVAVPLILALCLGAAWTFKTSLVSGERVLHALDGRLALTVPAGWTAEEDDGSVIVSVPTFGPAVGLVARIDAVPETGPMARDLFMARIAEERASEGLGYRVIDGGERRFGSVEGMLTHYALVIEPEESSALPVVVRGVDVVASIDDAHLLRLHVSGPAVEGALDPRLVRLLERVEVTP
jgi:hypothetical protein